MNNKTAKILKWAPTVLASLIIASTASMKLAAIPPLVEIYSKIGLLSWMQGLGIFELLFLTLFLLPRTLKLGFLLLTAYFGGAMAVEISHGTMFIIPGAILTLIWIAAYLRDTTIFISIQNQKRLVRSV